MRDAPAHDAGADYGNRADFSHYLPASSRRASTLS
jgi:hypothetical protein